MKGNLKNDKRKWLIRIEIESIAYGRRMTDRVSCGHLLLNRKIKFQVFDNFGKYRLADNSSIVMFECDRSSGQNMFSRIF